MINMIMNIGENLKKKIKINLLLFHFQLIRKLKKITGKQLVLIVLQEYMNHLDILYKESLDRKEPIIVSDIDGPKEIIEEVKDYVITYDVDVDNYKNDINNFSEVQQECGKFHQKKRKKIVKKQGMCLDKLRPEVIKEDWKRVIYEVC